MKKQTPTQEPAGAAAKKAIVVGAGLSGLTAAALRANAEGTLKISTIIGSVSAP
ncbi:MAG: hypothetical protein WBH66_08660 [Rectinemataceae bacterium]|jgi:ribulose 1,5-bisphosphate synthetase/thiazole synthase